MLEFLGETIAYFTGDDERAYEVDHLGRTNPQQDWGKCTIYRDRKQVAAFTITAPTLTPARSPNDIPASPEELLLLAQDALIENGVTVQLTHRL